MIASEGEKETDPGSHFGIERSSGKYINVLSRSEGNQTESLLPGGERKKTQKEKSI